ncbi:hypothetical protein ACKKBG_A30720 [Auxenochlorella protothecoides x Auxenochlorella symbiontica]
MQHGGSMGHSSSGGPLRRALALGSHLYQRHPLLIKCVTSGIGFAFGDVLTHLAAARARPMTRYSPRRTALMAAAGLCVAGPAGHVFLGWMEQHVMAATPMR